MLEPEPPQDVASNEDPTWDDSDLSGGEPGQEGAESEGSEGAEGMEGQSGGAEGELAEAQPGGGSPGGMEGAEEELAAAGGAPGGTPGEGEPGGSRAGGGSLPPGLPAGEEQGLDRELNRSLEVFDDEMQRTITILASAGGRGGEVHGAAGEESGEPGQGGQGSGPFDQTGEGSELVLVDGDPSLLPGGENAEGEAETDGEGRSGRQSNRSGMRGGSGRNETYPRVPADVGDGADDDVVARQIREAALNESDPVLREKLWQEYRNYKKSTK